VGASLGGWLALDYAIRRAAKVNCLALLAPAGIGRVRPGFILKAAPLLLLGPWGWRRALNVDMGFTASEAQSAENQVFLSFFRLVQQHFIARISPMPTFSDQMLRTVSIPVMAMLGGKDAILDSDETRRRLAMCLPQAQISYLPDVGHGLVDPTSPVLEFLLASTDGCRGSG